MSELGGTPGEMPDSETTEVPEHRRRDDIGRRDSPRPGDAGDWAPPAGLPNGPIPVEPDPDPDEIAALHANQRQTAETREVSDGQR